MGVISPIQKPMDWYVGMVTVWKQNRQVHICVDLTRLNESVKRGLQPLLVVKHILALQPIPVVERILAQLAGAKVFTKLDANSGFY